MPKSIAFLAVLWATGVSAQDRPETADHLFRTMRYEKGLEVTQQIMTSPDSESAQLLEAYLVNGLCLSALDRTDEALLIFRKLLSIKPDFQLSPEISPKLAATFYQAVALARGKPGISLEHRQPEAQARLAGLQVQVTLKSDPLGLVKAIRLIYRSGQEKPQRLVSGLKKPGTLTMTLPSDYAAPRVSYYFEALNQYGGALVRLPDKGQPFSLQGQRAHRIEIAPVVPEKTLAPPVIEVPPKPEPGPGPEEKPAAAVTSPWYQSWWFWTVVGVVVAGTATGVALGVSGSGSNDPSNYQLQVGL